MLMMKHVSGKRVWVGHLLASPSTDDLDDEHFKPTFGSPNISFARCAKNV
jgi:hypothetical protein